MFRLRIYVRYTFEEWLLWDWFCQISLRMRVRQNLFLRFFLGFFNIPDIVKDLKSKNSQGRNEKHLFLVKQTENNFVKRIAHARTSKFVFFVFSNIPDIVKVLKSKNK